MQYFLNLTQFIQHTASEETKTVRQKYTESRRKTEDHESYVTLVKEALEAGEQIAIKVESNVLRQLQITKEELDNTHQAMLANPQSAEATIQTQVGLHHRETKTTPILTKEKSLEMFDDFKERQAVLMKSIDGTYEAKMVKFAKMQDEFF